MCVCLRECAGAEGGTDGRGAHRRNFPRPFPLGGGRASGRAATRPSPGALGPPSPAAGAGPRSAAPAGPRTGRAEPGGRDASGRALDPLPGRPPPSVWADHPGGVTAPRRVREAAGPCPAGPRTARGGGATRHRGQGRTADARW